MTPEEKAWIDNATYEDLLIKWRFTKLGDPYFMEDERAAHFMKVMSEKKHQTNHVMVSKKVGWQ